MYVYMSIPTNGHPPGTLNDWLGTPFETIKSLSPTGHNFEKKIGHYKVFLTWGKFLLHINNYLMLKLILET